MTVTMELPDELANRLQQDAAKHGMSLAEYIVHWLATEQLLSVKPKNGAELVAYWDAHGLFGMRPDIVDSQAYARELREKAQTRQRA